MNDKSDLPRLGPKAAEDENPQGKSPRGLTLRALLPNAITAAALCAGLTGIRFAVSGEWSFAVLAVIIAGVLDGMDGRIARLLKAQSRFGAELDSLADNVSFRCGSGTHTVHVGVAGPAAAWLVRRIGFCSMHGIAACPLQCADRHR